ncbi:LysR family transcriptional regulator [Bacillus sp. EB106-08-02-XG196]|uniref:LysR family transcriptional regulator n=1 Tax=Bacillus sp. EB106-08-02-XG196 TaxID=2737049 RepID=UPI0015C4341B|nr:LysR family transcriptional regulator [Bacillus sp. EB106-08-02-XG196]NWQ41798.1 LysR family transcriptional regulator [Bacillus sp. EB106-08-02-XG196]
MDERDWMVLQTLYQEKNITNTAKILYISQPALTNRLKTMEKQFGVQIVIRGRRGVQFTSQGEYLAKSAHEMLWRIQKIKETVLNMEDKISGILRLGVSNFFTDYKLPGLLKLFKNQYPDVEFKVTTGLSSHITHLMHNQDVHIGFVRGDYSWQDQKKLLFEESICIASKVEIDIHRLPYLPRIDYHTDPLLKTAVDNWWTENYSQPPLVSINVDKADTCKKMVENGLGYAILPSLLINDLDNIHKFEIRTKSGEKIIRKTWMFYHEESLELNIVKAFVEFVEGMDLHNIK